MVQVQRMLAGFQHSVGCHFMGTALWLSDITGNFIAGRRELLKGSVVDLGLAP